MLKVICCKNPYSSGRVAAGDVTHVAADVSKKAFTVRFLLYLGSNLVLLKSTSSNIFMSVLCCIRPSNTATVAPV